MRRISVLLVPLFVVLLQTAAYAPDHWGRIFTTSPSPDQPLQALLGLLFVLSLIFILAWLIIYFLPWANAKCALFFAVGSVATMFIILEYVVILGFTAIGLSAIVDQQGLWLAFLGIYTIVVLWASLYFAAPCCLPTVPPPPPPVPPLVGLPWIWKAFIIAIVLAVLHIVYAWII